MNAPKYQVMRDLTQGEYDELKQSIIENGVLVPVITDERGHIIDGHHRKKICDELGITNYPRSIKMRLTEEQKIEMAYQLNEARRQLTPEEKRQMAEKRLRETPEISDRQIAKQVGASQPFVSSVRKEMEQSGQLITVISSIGADGKERPRQVERKPTGPDDTEEPPDGDMEGYADEDEDDAPGAKVISLAGRQRQKEDEGAAKYDNGSARQKSLEKALGQIQKLQFADADIDDILYYLTDFTMRGYDPVGDQLSAISAATKTLNNIYTKLLQAKERNNGKKRF